MLCLQYMWGLFIQKANQKRISVILKKEGFIYTDHTVANLLKGNEKGIRYGNVVLLRNENGTQTKRFIKIILDGKWKTYQLFKRQVKITAALHDGKNYKSPTLTVIRCSLTPPVPYVIFETLEDGNGFGFMHDTPAFYERFTESEMQKIVEVMYAFHRAGFNVERSTLKLTRPIPSKLGFYKKECNEWLDTRITHKTKEGQEMTKRVEELLAMYMGISDVRARIMQALEKNFVQVQASKTTEGSYLVHADMQIDNVYKHANGDFELLDFEWVGRSDNPIVPILFDYGNLRARAWSSLLFQEMLDKAMLEIGKMFYPEEVVKAGIMLGTLRSSLLMSRYHMDFINTVKKDKRAEEDYFTMFPLTIDALAQTLR